MLEKEKNQELKLKNNKYKYKRKKTYNIVSLQLVKLIPQQQIYLNVGNLTKILIKTVEIPKKII